jgi:hypothetical protein
MPDMSTKEKFPWKVYAILLRGTTLCHESPSRRPLDLLPKGAFDPAHLRGPAIGADEQIASSLATGPSLAQELICQPSISVELAKTAPPELEPISGPAVKYK